MRTLLPDPPPPPFDELLERRRRLDQDRRDEVWEGVLHMIPPPSHEHERLSMRLAFLLMPLVDAAGLELTGAVGIGDEGNFRVPDLVIHRLPAAEQWHPTAALVVEILSPNDDTPKKLPFYAEHDIDELLIVDPQRRYVDWRALESGEYRPVERSRLIALGPTELTRQLGWSS